MPKVDLSLVSTAELIQAAIDRFDGAVFHGRVARPAGSGDKTQVYSIRTKGDAHTCIGLAYTVMSFCQGRMNDGDEELNSDDL